MTRDPLVSLVAEVGGRLVAWFGWACRWRRTPELHWQTWVIRINGIPHRFNGIDPPQRLT